jgi:hypothetical protein
MDDMRSSVLAVCIPPGALEACKSPLVGPYTPLDYVPSVQVIELIPLILRGQASVLKLQHQFHEATTLLYESYRWDPAQSEKTALYNTFRYTRLGTSPELKGAEIHGMCQDPIWFSSTVLHGEEQPLFCTSDGQQEHTARVLVLGDSHSTIWHYINHVTGSRTFDCCTIAAVSALGLTNPKSNTKLKKKNTESLTTVRPW